MCTLCSVYRSIYLSLSLLLSMYRRHINLIAIRSIIKGGVSEGLKFQSVSEATEQLRLNVSRLVPSSRNDRLGFRDKRSTNQESCSAAGSGGSYDGGGGDDSGDAMTALRCNGSFDVANSNLSSAVHTRSKTIQKRTNQFCGTPRVLRDNP